MKKISKITILSLFFSIGSIGAYADEDLSRKIICTPKALGGETFVVTVIGDILIRTELGVVADDRLSEEPKLRAVEVVEKNTGYVQLYQGRNFRLEISRDTPDQEGYPSTFKGKLGSRQVQKELFCNDKVRKD